MIRWTLELVDAARAENNPLEHPFLIIIWIRIAVGPASAGVDSPCSSDPDCLDATGPASAGIDCLLHSSKHGQEEVLLGKTSCPCNAYQL